MSEQDQQPQAVPEEVVAETHPEASPAEESQQPADAPTEEAVASEEAPATESAQPEKSNRFAKRLSDVAEKARTDERQRLETETKANQPFVFPWQQQTPEEDNPEVSALRSQLSEVQQTVQKQEDERFWQGVHADFEQVARTYPQLDDSSPDFDPEYLAEVSALYEEAIGSDPRKAPKLSSIVARFDKVRTKAAAQAQAKSQAVLTQQANEAAINPSGTAEAPKTKFEDLSIAEMEAKLGYAR